QRGTPANSETELRSRRFLPLPFSVGPLLCAALALASRPFTLPPPYLHAPSVTTYARHDPGGLTILPTGRYLQPVGRHTPLARWPHGLALSPDGAILFAASKGVGQADP